MVKLKQFESALSAVEAFESPKIELEQYPTSAHLAARMMMVADSQFDDIEGKTVLDLGTGTGMLGIAAEMMGCEAVVGVDIDTDALEIAQRNIEELELEMDLVQANVLMVQDGNLPFRQGQFDTVVTNPPFGTRKKGADVGFLVAALKMSNHAVYSLHKSSTRSFLERKATKEWGVSFQVIAEMRFDIPKMYKFHKKKSADVCVDLIRLCKPKVEEQEQETEREDGNGSTSATLKV